MKKAVLNVDHEIFLRTDYRLIFKKGKEVEVVNEELSDEKMEVECEVIKFLNVRFEIYKKHLDIHYDI